MHMQCNIQMHMMMWLEQHDYIGELDKAGFFDGVAVYALYDELRISYKEILAELKKEAERQAH